MHLAPADPIADFIFGIVFSLIGLYSLVRRKKIIDALMASNKVFWDKLGFATKEKQGLFMANIMIPFMGAVFFFGGCIAIYRFIIYLLK